MLSNVPQFNVARNLLLDLWQHLLGTVDMLVPADLTNHMRAIALLTRRKEFDMAYLRVDVLDKPHCNETDLQIAHRSRVATCCCFVSPAC
jgi:hypothetical protein